MKSSVLLIAAFYPFLIFSQLSEHFSDGNFTVNPIWMGDSANFKVNANLELQLDAPSVSDISVLYTKSRAISNAIWQFHLKMDFNPSSSNYAQVYIAGTKKDFKLPQEAYFVRIGDSEDEVSLYYQNGTKTEKIIDGMDKRLLGSTTELSVRLSRDSLANWQLEVRPAGSPSYWLEGSTQHDSLDYASYFAVYCKYSSTRSNKFFFDSIEVRGLPYMDSLAPECTGIQLLSSNSVQLFFSEVMDSLTMMVDSAYAISAGVGKPSSIIADSSLKTVMLEFSSSFPINQQLQLNLNGLRDTAGNLLATPFLSFIYKVNDTATSSDIRITEIMADPEPAMELPAAEYVEIHNLSSKRIQLKGVTMADQNTVKSLGDFIIEPFEYVILCSQRDSVALSEYGRVWAAEEIPSLNNASDLILLRNSNKLLLDSVTYSNTWYTAAEKKNGGWSLERIRFESNCQGNFNWDGSIDPRGGSPGKANSILDTSIDSTPLSIKKLSWRRANKWLIEFNKVIDSSTSKNLRIELEGQQVPYSFSRIGPMECVLRLETKLKEGPVHLIFSGLQDCFGNMLNHEVELIVPSMPLEQELIINEILFDPIGNGSDYLELYNNSSKYIDLHYLNSGNFSDEGDSIIKSYAICPSSCILKPYRYAVITMDSIDLKLKYPYPEWRQIIHSTLPPMNNEQGIVIISDSNNLLIDRMAYHEDMHFELLNTTEGVSLERLNYSFPSSDPSNWHSAAADYGYGTPGYRNSQFLDHFALNSDFTLISEIISPDNDGKDDVLSILYQLKQPGYICRIRVLDRFGNAQAEIANNLQLATNGSIQWNGLNADFRPLPIGIYVLLIELYHPNGTNDLKRLPFVVARNLSN